MRQTGQTFVAGSGVAIPHGLEGLSVPQRQQGPAPISKSERLNERLEAAYKNEPIHQLVADKPTPTQPLRSSSEVFSVEFKRWFAEWQFSHAWLWRKRVEPGGTSNESVRRFSSLPEKDLKFIEKMSEGILEYLRLWGSSALTHLREVGTKMHEIGVDLDVGENVLPLKGIPLKDGSMAVIDQGLLNALAYDNHILWTHIREWTWTLKDTSLHQPQRRDHAAWDRMRPDIRWNGDRGNIYGLAISVAMMPDEMFKVLMDSSFPTTQLYTSATNVDLSAEGFGSKL